MIDLKKLRLATLSENTAKWLWLIGEWGWSMCVEADGLKLLFDAGLNISAARNAAVMGIELKTIGRMLLSHGHMDHTGGLRDVLQRMGAEKGRSCFYDRQEHRVEIIAHPDVWGPKYVKYPEAAEYCFRGVPFQKVELEERQGALFNESREPIWVDEDIVWSGEIPMKNDFEKIAPICFLKKTTDAALDDDAGFEPDPIHDDAALYLRTERGLVIILGCAHHGMINTIHHAQQLTGMEKIHMVVGGTHLISASEHQMEETLRELKRLKVAKVGVSHCTGFESSAKMLESLGPEIFFCNNAGNVISF